MAEKKQLYVGCGLTHAPEEFRNNVEAVKNRLRQDWHVMDFLGLVNGTPRDVYQRDIIENVGGCDAFVGVIDEPSFGLGWEAREAVGLAKPTLIVANASLNLNRLAVGAAEFWPTLRIRQYEDLLEDVPGIVAEEFAVVLNGVAKIAP